MRYSGDKIVKDEVDRSHYVCSREVDTGFWLGNLK
jgi:hypothetical protein